MIHSLSFEPVHGVEEALEKRDGRTGWIMTLGAFAIALAASVSGPAMAQGSSAPAAKDETPGDTKAARAISDDEDNGTILVTARRRDESLQDVPIAVTAVSASTLENTRIESSSQLTFVTPGLTMGYRGQASTPFLRGVGNSDPATGAESPIAMYVDGVYMTNVYASTLPFNNIERVEVLKGPQGTLFGRNATGGLIQVVTRDPTQTPSLDASVSYGNYDTITSKAYISSGITENLAADFAGYYSNQGKGYGVNVFTGNDWFKTREWAIRSKWVFQPTDSTKMTLIGDYRKSNSDAAQGYLIIPGSIGGLGDEAQPGFFELNSNLDPFNYLKNGGVSLRIDQEMGSFQLMSLSSYRFSKYSLGLDTDSSPLRSTDFYANAKTTTLTQEFQFSSLPGSSFQWVAGLFYLNDYQRYVGPNCLGLYGFAFSGSPDETDAGVQFCNGVRVESYAAYAEGTLNLGSKTQLTIGGRISHDRKELGALTNSIDNDGNVTSFPAASITKKWTSPTWRAIINHKLTEDNSVYASYSRGFKSGGFNVIDITAPAYDPEKIDAFEIGSKNQFFDGKVTLNIAAFYYKYADLQLYRQFATSAIVINAANAEIKGGEVELSVRPVRGLNIHSGLAYLSGKYKDFRNAPCTEPLPGGGNSQLQCDASGNAISRSPKWTFNLNASYEIPTSIGTIGATGLFYWSDRFPWEPDNRIWQKSYSIVNASVMWRDLSDRFEVSLWTKNLTNKDYYAHALTSGIGDQYSPAPPRTYGLELRVHY